ncbi:hypothetical protein [Pseudomonas gessardii]|uniref:hypothetical protein n=1 Tax=Pseudomonas gessardii TaxID=78544 RepID=UPI001474AE64|nr:hypothetical protein [Pseudomonas gessardii]NNA92597.1 hypothetical protein [Pseudomonas gessardii]
MAMTLLDENSSLRATLRVVLSWIRENYKYFTVEPFSTYGIDEFSHIDESLMPVEFSSFLPSDIAHLKKGRRQKLSATPDLSGTVLPYVLFRTQR